MVRKLLAGIVGAFTIATTVVAGGTAVSAATTPPVIVDATTAQVTGASPYRLTLDPNVTISDLTGSDFSNSGTATGCVFTPSGSTITTDTGYVDVRCQTAGTIIATLAANSVAAADGTRGPSAPVVFASATTNPDFAPVETTPVQPSSQYPYYLRFTSNTEFSNLSGESFDDGVVTQYCFFDPDRTSGTVGTVVTVTVECVINQGTFTPRIKAGSMRTAIGAAPAADFLFAPRTNSATTPAFSNRTPSVSPSSPLTLRFRSNTRISDLGASDFSYTGTALGCAFAPAADTYAAQVDIIVTVTCRQPGSIIPVLKANSVFAPYGRSGPASAFSFGSLTVGVADVTRAADVEAGLYSTCALLDDGQVTCWGYNTYGQLGNNDNTDTNTPGTPITLPAGHTATAITAGNAHTCALLDNGQITCWGYNTYGQLGNNDNTDTTTPGTPITLPAGHTATAITAGNAHTCALLDNGQITCWGYNTYGQLGNNDNTDTTTPGTPITLPAGHTATAITAGNAHTCALLDNGQITCWGNNTYGQLGNNDNTDTTTPGTPITLPAGHTATAITAGSSHTCALLDDGQVTCWGNNFVGQLGNGTSSNTTAPGTPITLPAGHTATAITASSSHTCAVLDNGQVTCWGYNLFGQLGNSTNTNTTAPGTPITLPAGHTATAITTGMYYTCAVLDNGQVTCWGYNLFGQLGNGTNTKTNTPRGYVTLTPATFVIPSASPTTNPFDVTFSTSAASTNLTSGDFTFAGSATGCSATPTSSTAARFADYTVRIRCATSGSTVLALRTGALVDTLGNSFPYSTTTLGTYTVPSPAQLVTDTTGFVPTSRRFTLRLRFRESVTGLEVGDVVNALSPADGGADCTFIPSSANPNPGIDVLVSTTCTSDGELRVVLSSGSVLAGGTVPLPSAAESILSTTVTNASEPRPVLVAAGTGHTCALLDNGQITCWGNNADGQLGNGTNISTNTPGTPITLPTGRTAAAVTTGTYYTCALLDNGQITCWGNNSNGQLGNGTTTSTSTPGTPITLPTGRTATAVSAGGNHTCALLDNGQITCWGYNVAGQLGNGTNTSTSTPGTPITLPAGRTATAVTAGGNHTCALLDNGQITCWGFNTYGQLGNGTSGPSANTTEAGTPITLPAGRTAAAIATGSSHTCALLDNGQITCWGRNDVGGLGNGTISNRSTPGAPISLPAGRTATSVTGGSLYTCALLDNGQITCWGDNANGQLGNGTNGNYTTTPGPTITLPTSRTALAITTRFSHTCALLDNGQITCWGQNSYGQLGNGTVINSSAPNTFANLDFTRFTETTSPQSITASPYTISFTTSAAINGLTADDFEFSGTAGGCSVSLSTTNFAAGTVSLPVTCTNEGTIVVTMRSDAVTDDSGRQTAPTTPVVFASHTYNNGPLIISVPTTPTPTTDVLILRFSASKTFTGLSGSDFANSGTASGCVFTPTSTSAAASIAVIVAVRCTGAGTLEPSLNALSMSDPDGVAGPAVAADLGSFDFRVSSPTTRLESVALDAGRAHTCTLLDNGQITCWGQNSYGQLGNGAYTDTSAPGTPITLPAGRTATAVTAGDNHTCALLDNGQITCWGRNSYGQLGNGTNGPSASTSAPGTPITLPAGRTATAVTAGDNHTCALLDNGQITCWGGNSYGQLGNGTNGPSASTSAPGTPITLPAGRTATAVTTGSNHTCALLDNGQITCWGYNLTGQLGNGTKGVGTNTNAPGTRPISLPASRVAISVTSSDLHTCALLDNGQITCWGSNWLGQFGNGTSTNSQSSPVPSITPAAGQTAVAVDAGSDHTCALHDNGQISCWGYNRAGQLSNGSDLTISTLPLSVTLPAFRTAVAVTAGEFHTCALLDNNQVTCWGGNGSRQLGLEDGAPRGAVVPLWRIPVTTTTTLASNEQAPLTLVVVGAEGFTGLDSTDFAYTGTASGCRFTPVSTTGAAGIPLNVLVRCSTAGTFGPSLKARSVKDSFGVSAPATAVNFGTTTITPGSGFVIDTTTSAPTNLSFILRARFDSPVTGLSSGDFTNGYTGSDAASGCSFTPASSTAAAGIDVVIRGTCTGSGVVEPVLAANSVIDSVQSTGPSTALSFGTHVIDNDGATRAVDISALSSSACALLDDNSVKCWGHNDVGQLGTGDLVDRGASPLDLGSNLATVPVGTGRLVASLSSSSDFFMGDFTCAVRDNGTVTCWGGGGFSGDVDLGSESAVAVSAGRRHACVLLASGAVRCWGSNIHGQLGLGHNSAQATPQTSVDLGAGRHAVRVEAFDLSTCAVLDNGTMKCWGNNYSGQLGVGDNTNRNAPVSVDLGVGRRVLSVSGGVGHICAALDNGTMKCWGENYYGQLGDGGNTNTNSPVSTNLPSGRTAVSVAAGDWHTCAIFDDHSTRCWGDNNDGQLGYGDTTHRGSPGSAIDLGTGRTATTIVGGFDFTCALLDDGMVRCWGANSYGQLGAGDTVSRGDGPSEMGDQLTPVDLLAPSTTSATVISESGSNPALMAITFGVDITGLGSEDFVNLGSAADCTFSPLSSEASAGLPVLLAATCATSGTLTVRLVANSVADAAGATGPFRSRDFASTLIDVDAPTFETGTVPEFVPSRFIVRMTPDDSVRGLSADDFEFSGSATGCSIQPSTSRTDQQIPITLGVRCMEPGTLTVVLRAKSVTDAAGNLGPVDDVTITSVTVDEYAARGPVSIDAGSGHTCALLIDGSTRCWGLNASGQLGGVSDGAVRALPTTDGAVSAGIDAGGTNSCVVLNDGTSTCWGSESSSFAPIDGVGVGIVASGLEHTCIVDVAGLAWCRGVNIDGRLGHGTISARESTPVNVLTSGPVRDVVSGDTHSCALVNDGTVECWGAGNPTPSNVYLGMGRTATAISAGGDNTCAILDDASLSCWDIVSQMPAIISIGSGRSVESVSVGTAHACAIRDDGTLVCWGDNLYGRLGIGSSASTLTPSLVDLGTGRAAVAVTVGVHHTCAIRDDGAITCWGRNNHRQLGVVSTATIGDEGGEMGDSLAPVQLFATPAGVDSTGVIASVKNPLVFRVRFDRDVRGLSWQDFSFTGSTATGCNAAPQANTVEADTDVDIVVLCVGSGNVVLRLAADAVTSREGVTGPASDLVFATITGLDTAPPRITSASVPSAVRNGGTFSFVADKWYEGLESGDFAQLGTASGCVLTPSADRAEAGVSVTVAVSCTSDGSLTTSLAASSVFDVNGNPGPMPNYTFAAFTVDNAAPVTAVNMPTPAPASFPFDFLVEVSEAFTGLTSADFTNSGTATGCTFTPARSSAAGPGPITVSVTCSVGGTVSPQLRSGAISDPAGNPGPISATAGAPITITTSRPQSFSPLTPVRIMDTRTGVGVRTGRVVDGFVELQVTGRGNVPVSGVAAVSLNVTVTGTTTGLGDGYVTVYPCGTRPDASNLNFTAGQTIPNAVITPVSNTGTVCFYVYGGAHLLADVNGYGETGSGFTPVSPARIMDTRIGVGAPATRVVDRTVELQVTGRGNVPVSGVAAVSLNVTVTGTTTGLGDGYVTVYPCGTRPDASNLNFTAGQTIPNAVITPVSNTGTVCFYVYGGAHLLADVNGWYGSGSGFTGLTPVRVLDTRTGVGAPRAKVGLTNGLGAALELDVLGRGNVPASGVAAVSLNVTVTNTTIGQSDGYVTVYPCGTRPDASNLNFTAGQTIPNAVLSPIGSGGKICIYVFGQADVLADVNGYFTS